MNRFIAIINNKIRKLDKLPPDHLLLDGMDWFMISSLIRKQAQNYKNDLYISSRIRSLFYGKVYCGF